jgi:hypothetical protein
VERKQPEPSFLNSVYKLYQKQETMSKLKEAFLNNLSEEEMDEMDDSLDLSDEPTEKVNQTLLNNLSDAELMEIGNAVFGESEEMDDLMNGVNFFGEPCDAVIVSSSGFQMSDIVSESELGLTMSDSKETLFNNLSEAEATEIFNAVFRESKSPSIPKIPKFPNISESKKVYVQFRVQLKLRSSRDVANLLGVISQKVELVDMGKSINLSDYYYEIGYTLDAKYLLKFLDLLDEYIGKVDEFVCKSEIV